MSTQRDCEDVETEFPYPEQAMALTDYTAWTHEALEWIQAQRAPFTADDLRAALPSPPHPNLVGAAFNTASKYKLIQVAGYQRSTAASRKHSLLRLWWPTTEETR